MASKSPTKLKKIVIKRFRGLSDITIDFANRITLICGKNGTSKSSILGIAGQVFNFRKDYTSGSLLSYKTLAGGRFKSPISEHFRLSKRFDTTGSMDTEIHIHDGYTNSAAEFSLKLYNSADRIQPRPVVRGNTTAPGVNTSRNATHPVIFLSLGRLLPISNRGEYKAYDLDYLKAHKDDFLRCTQKILGKFSSTTFTPTTGTINSVAVHSDSYDQDSVSAGEDNIGQILLAVFSFRKLKEEYPDYKGGLLLIDEADAGLFPAAQIELLNFLNRECKALDLQVVMTSHSPTMIEMIHDANKRSQSDNKTVYLTDSYGSITTQSNFSWSEIYADLHQQTVVYDKDVSLPLVNIYFEDQECADLFSALVTARNTNKAINKLSEVALGCNEYIKLIERKIPEFRTKSIVVLDGDVQATNNLPSIIKLPSGLPPDQLIFEFLFNMEPNDPFWKNKCMYTKSIFLKSAQDIISSLSIPAGATNIDLAQLASDYQKNKKANQKPLRVLFKDFARDKDFVRMAQGPVSTNPYRVWAKRNPTEAMEFRASFTALLKRTLVRGFGVDAAKLAVLD